MQLRLIKNRPKIIVLGDGGTITFSFGAELSNYEEMIANYEVHFEYADFAENTHLACATRLTTGSPKGVLYSHRSTTLHAMQVALSFSNALYECARVTDRPFVSCQRLGVAVCLPTDCFINFCWPVSRWTEPVQLMDNERATSAWGVPTVLTACLKK